MGETLQATESSNGSCRGRGEASSYGTHQPPPMAAPLLWMVRWGLARGAISRWLRRVWKLRLPNVVDVKRRGIRYRLNVSDNVTDAKILLSSKFYDGVEIDHLARTCVDGVFIDIGANTGYYSLNLAKAGARIVLAIEPNPPTFHRLEFNVKCNGFAKSSIRPIQSAIGPAGTSELHLTASLGSASLTPLEDARYGTVQVQSLPLLDLLRRQEIEAIDGLKIDIEGYEFDALAPFFCHAPQSLLPRCVVVEVCNSHAWESDVIKLLAENGFQVTTVTRSNAVLHRFNQRQN